LTNKHVVSDTAAEYTVFFNDGSKIAAKVLARDPYQDLAVVKIEKKNLPTLPFADSSDIDIGQGVIAIGNALGEFKNTVSVGIVSGLGRSVSAVGDTGTEDLQGLIQTDASINQGGSGGPLLNLHGEVIGINTAIASDAENIGFAIPVSKAKRDIENVKTHGRIIYPFIGIRYAIVTKAMQEEKKLSVDHGAILVSGDREPAIVAASPAEKAGLKEGDIILMIDGQTVDQDRTIADVVQQRSVGDKITIKILRCKDEMTAEVTLAERKQ
ncbi:MAG: trypsin-like peptidase domain-containing protein, partial [Candidatus Sungbacteria bacterium]|nr:trypsin-like peptidase domain-containing protein [Candidatus Sungbacteria bacterium]